MNVWREFRNEMRWTQARAAKEFGGVPSRWRNYELGLRTPSPEAAHRLIDLAARHGRQITLEDVYPRPAPVDAERAEC